MSETTLTTIPIDRVRVDNRLRGLNEDQVARLVESIREIGLLNPITVWAMPGTEGNMVEPGYGIVAGAHRLEACKRLGYTEITAIVVDLPDLKRQLAEVDENLAGPTLTKAERALFTKRRKEIYVALHPETRHGAIGGGHDQKSQTLRTLLRPTGSPPTRRLASAAASVPCSSTRPAARISLRMSLKPLRAPISTLGPTSMPWPSCPSSSSRRSRRTFATAI